MKIKEFTIYGFGKHFKNKILISLKKFKNIQLKTIISRKGINYDHNLNELILLKKLNEKFSTEYVYISTPIAIHYKNIIEVFNFKKVKIIICEKTLTNDYSKSLEVINMCKKNKILLLEAYMYKYHPQFTKIKKLIKHSLKNDKKGKIFCRYTIPEIAKNDHRKNNNLTGGIIHEIGCYPISLIYFLLEIDLSKLKNIKILKIIKKNKKELIHFKLNNLHFILSWGYNSNYRNHLIFRKKNKAIIGYKIFGKKIEDNINIKVENKNISNEYNFKNSDNFYYMFKHFFSLKNNYKTRLIYFKEIQKINQLINYFKH